MFQGRLAGGNDGREQSKGGVGVNQVRDAMIQVERTARPSHPVALALRMMREQNIGFLPVIADNGSLYGIVTEGDLVRLIHRTLTEENGQPTPFWLRGATREMLQVLPIREVVSRQVDTIGPDAFLEEAAEIMFSRHRRVLPVVDADGKVLGYLTRTAIIDMLI